jgi:hypothetical protein
MTKFWIAADWVASLSSVDITPRFQKVNQGYNLDNDYVDRIWDDNIASGNSEILNKYGSRNFMSLIIGSKARIAKVSRKDVMVLWDIRLIEPSTE